MAERRAVIDYDLWSRLNVDYDLWSRLNVDYDLWSRLNVRKWGLPIQPSAGRAWRNDDRANPTISIYVQVGDVIEVQTARVIWSDARRYLFPRGWREAFAHYVDRWPGASRWQRRALGEKPAATPRRRRSR